MTALKTGQVQRTYVVADRGDRPAVRGWFHLVAAALSAISSAVLITFGWMTLPWPQALGVTIYGAGVVLLLMVRHGLVYGAPPFSATLEELGRDAELLDRIRDAQDEDEAPQAPRREEA